MKIILYLLFAFSLTTCQSETNRRLAYVLQTAGDNRPELEKVLEHYQHDTLKLKAAQFLISNMPGYVGYDPALIQKLQPVYEKHIAISEKYNWEKPLGWRKEIKDMWENEKKKIDTDKYPMKQDIKIIKADWLINEIDLSFKAWKENAYTKDASFEDFCHYILPYRFTDQYCLDSYRQIFYNRHHGFFSKKTDDFKAVTDSLHFKYSYFIHSVGVAASMPICDIATYEQIKRGICEDQTRFNSLLMSALGMPIATDFTPAWGNRTSGHNWNALIIEGKTYPFEPFWDKERWKYDKIYNNETIDLVAKKFRLPKVFRHTFEYYLEDSPVTDKKEKRENIPNLFKNLRMKDVSSQYFKVTDVNIDITEDIPKDTRYCYLCVFEPKKMTWTPVQWGKIEKKKVVFKAMGRDIVYLPAFYNNGTIIPAAPVFILNQKGDCQVLKHTDHRMNITTTTVNDLNLRYREMIAGATLVGCKSLTKTKQQDTLYTVNDTIDSSYNSVRLYPKEKYRYVRLLPKQDTLALSEISFYEQQGDSIKQIPNVNIIADVSIESSKELDKIIDNLSGTGCFITFGTEKEKKEGVLFDLGKPYSLDSLSFTPQAKSHVNTDADFILYYWDNKWVKEKEIKGNSDYITFEQIPSDALYLIKSSIPITDPYYAERIFTYKNGMLYWW